MRLLQYGLEQDEAFHPQLVEERSFRVRKEPYSSPQKIADLVNFCFGDIMKKAEEYVYMIAFTTAIMPLGIFEISHGTINSSLISARELMIRALLCGAANIVIIHNHPSGNVKPSQNDERIYSGIKVACEMIGIPLMDFIILGEDVFSFKAEGIY